MSCFITLYIVFHLCEVLLLGNCASYHFSSNQTKAGIDLHNQTFTIFVTMTTSQNALCLYYGSIEDHFCTSWSLFYENTPMQYAENLLAVKMKIFTGKKNDIFLIFAQNIDCGYTARRLKRVNTVYVLEQK